MFDFKQELKKIAEQKIDTQFTDCEKEVNATFKVLNNTINRLLKKQGAMSMQVEEMYSILEEDETKETMKELEKENEKVINTLITAADLIEDFYIYYKEYPDETMAVQSGLMWNTILKAMAASGLLRISDENTPFNIQLNTIEGVMEEPSLPNGIVLKVLKSGYQYQGKVYRKSTVIVNKRKEKE